MTAPLYVIDEPVKVGPYVGTIKDVNNDFDDTPISYDVQFAGVPYVTLNVPETVIDAMNPQAVALRARVVDVDKLAA